VRSTCAKWLLGSLAFLLPALVAAVSLRLDKSPYRHDALYRMLIAPVLLGAVVSAVAVPAVLIGKARLSLRRRAGLIAAVWGMLLVQFYMIFIAVLSGAH
jgi:hypothetical protein